GRCGLDLGRRRRTHLRLRTTTRRRARDRQQRRHAYTENHPGPAAAHPSDIPSFRRLANPVRGSANLRYSSPMLRVTAWWWAWLGLQPIADARPATAPPEAHGSPVLEAGIDPGLAAFARDRTTPGRLWIGKLASNGGREVVIYV